MLKNTSLTLLATVLSLGCASPNKTPLRTLDEALGVSISLDRSHGWRLYSHNSERIAFSQSLDSTTYHTAALILYSQHGPLIHSEFSASQHLARIEQDLLNQRDRNRDLEFSISRSTVRTAQCVELHRVEDGVASTGVNGQTMTLNLYEYICLHPKRPNLCVSIQYSERYVSQSRPAASLGAKRGAVEAMRFLEFLDDHQSR
jgi:hypothetical protein